MTEAGVKTRHLRRIVGNNCCNDTNNEQNVSYFQFSFREEVWLMHTHAHSALALVYTIMYNLPTALIPARLRNY